jgi:hypothetical protein
MKGEIQLAAPGPRSTRHTYSASPSCSGSALCSLSHSCCSSAAAEGRCAGSFSRHAVRNARHASLRWAAAAHGGAAPQIAWRVLLVLGAWNGNAPHSSIHITTPVAHTSSAAHSSPAGGEAPARCPSDRVSHTHGMPLVCLPTCRSLPGLAVGRSRRRPVCHRQLSLFRGGRAPHCRILIVARH